MFNEIKKSAIFGCVCQFKWVYLICYFLHPMNRTNEYWKQSEQGKKWSSTHREKNGHKNKINYYLIFCSSINDFDTDSPDKRKIKKTTNDINSKVHRKVMIIIIKKIKWIKIGIYLAPNFKQFSNYSLQSLFLYFNSLFTSSCHYT